MNSVYFYKNNQTLFLARSTSPFSGRSRFESFMSCSFEDLTTRPQDHYLQQVGEYIYPLPIY